MNALRKFLGTLIWEIINNVKETHSNKWEPTVGVLRSFHLRDKTAFVLLNHQSLTALTPDD